MTDFPHTRSIESSRALIAPLLQEPVERFVLPNGLTVLLKPDAGSQVCSVQVWVKTGSVHEGRHLGSGISHFVEHMIFKGTERRPGKELSQAVHEAGGYINAYTTFGRTVYYIDVPADRAEVALDVLSDAVFASVFPAPEVDKEREVINREIAMGEDDPDSKLSHALFETCFREHSYRYPIIGYSSVFNSLTREDLVGYYRERYVPNNSVLVVAGDFAVGTMRALAERWFGGIARRALPAILVPDEPPQLAERRLDLYEDVQIVRVGLGFQSPGLAHPDAPALDALAMALGHGDSSLLYQRLREESQLAHTIDVSNWTPGAVGVFFVSMICDPDKRDAAMVELRRYLDGLRAEDFTQEMVEKATRQLLVNEINARKTASGQASRVGAAEVVVGDIGYAGNYLRRVGEVTAAELYRVLRKWIRWERMSVVTVNPKEMMGGAIKGAAGAHAALQFEDLKQANGSRLLIRKNERLPNLHFRLVMQAGPLLEPAGKQGATSLLATMMTKDTAKRTALEVAEAIEGAGGSFGEFSGNNSMGFALEVLPTDADLALDLLEEALLRPSFEDEVFEMEKESHLAGIKESMDDIVSAGRKALRERFFGEHPFACGGSGTLDTVQAVSLDDIRELWTSLTVAENATLAVSGSFDRTALLPKLEALLAKLPSGSVSRPLLKVSKPAFVGNHRVRMDRQQAVVFHAYPAPGLKDADYFVTEVADELFSGMSSVLFDRVREQLSLAYFVRSSRMVGLDTSMFYFYAGTAPARYEEVVAELERETRRVAEGGVSAEELERCRNRLKAARRMSMQTNSACASHVALNATYGLEPNDWQEYDRRIDGVTLADLQRFASQFLIPEKRVELVIGPGF